MVIKGKVSNLNWYVFGLALLTVGMALITWHPAWIVAGGVSLFLFGASFILNLSVKVAIRAMEEGRIRAADED